MNNVCLVGRLTKDVVLKCTQNNKLFCYFTVAVNRKKEEVDFIQCIAWENIADNMAQYLSKGSLVGVTGSIQTRSYDNNNNQKVYVTEVVARSVQFLETKNNSRPDTVYPLMGTINKETLSPIYISDEELPI